MSLSEYFESNGFKSIKDTGKQWQEVGEMFGISGEAARKQMARHWLSQIDSSNLQLKSQWEMMGKDGEIITLKSYRVPSAKEQNVEEVFEKVYDKLFSKYNTFQIPTVPIHKYPSSKIALLNLYDAHLDKLPVLSTCGTSSTIEENVDKFLKAVDKCLTTIQPHTPEKIIFPIGNDLFHTNGFDRKTKKGTELEYSGSVEDNYYIICDAVIEAILRASQLCTVEVLMVKGNHDEDKVTGLGYWLERTFKGNPNITVEKSRSQRKYIEYGANMLMFAHGDKEKNIISKVPLLMASEEPALWGRTKYRKCFFGDLHHGFEYQFLKAKDQPGVEIEYLRSVGTTDTWHKDFGWIGVPKTAYVQIIDKEEGEFARFKIPV